MKTVLIYTAQENARTDYLTEIVAQHCGVRLMTEAGAVLDALHRDPEELVALIVDTPSETPGVAEITDCVRDMNSYLFAVPILLLTDAAHREADETCLDDTVLDVIERGTSARVVLQRIEKANAAVNSFSFLEFSRMLKALPSLIYLKDAKGRYVFCSKYMHHLSHFRDDHWSIRGKTDLEVRRDPDNARAAYESDMAIIASGRGASYIIEENEDGEQEFLQLIKEPVRDAEGKVRGIIAIINNVTEQEKLRRELRKKSVTDELTGLNNRTYYEEFIARLTEDIYPLGVLSADCDGLKEINDRFGHPVGDEYIRMTATLLHTVLPQDAIKIRTGGDEFLALLPRADEEIMAAYLDALRDAQKLFSIRERPLSVSFGAAVMHGGPESIVECVARSDSKMYRNKRMKKKKHTDAQA